MNEQIIQSLYKLFSVENISGLDSIYQMVFHILFIKFNIFNMKASTNINSSLSLMTYVNYIKKQLVEANDIYYEFSIKNISDNIVETINDLELSELNPISLINDIFYYHYKMDNLSVIKDYIKYYNNKLLSSWIVDLANPKIDTKKGNLLETVFDGNLKINSYLDVIIEKANKNKINWANNKDKLFGLQTNQLVKDMCMANFTISMGEVFGKNIISNDILLNDIETSINSFDLIIFDMPNGLHNIVHASCCHKIKKLKIRGTKSEPLLLQLIMTSLNKNGRVVAVVPDSLLFSDSIQPIETRKYLLENFNVKKIVQIDEALYFGRGVKNSILYFENNGKTSSVEFSKISLNNNIIVETKLSDISFDKIKNNIHSLYYKNYENTINSNINDKLEYVSINDVFDIYTNTEIKTNNKVLTLTKYYKNEHSVCVYDNIKSIKSSDTDNIISYYFVDKANVDYVDGFMIKYLESVLRSKHDQFVKGKMNQFDISKINEIKIPVLSKNKQLAVCNYINISKKIIANNNEKINMFKELKRCVIDSIPLESFVELKNISKIYLGEKLSNNKLIGIIRNGLTAGSVYRLDDLNQVSTNSHYLVMSGSEYNLDYVYHWLLHNEDKLKELANLTSQSNLNQNNLLSFKIPKIDIEKQNEVISYCNDFESQIIKYELDNKSNMEKDIWSTILKLNNM